MMTVNISSLTREKLNRLIERGDRFYVRGNSSDVLSGSDIEDRTDAVRYVEDSEYIIISKTSTKQGDSKSRPTRLS